MYQRLPSLELYLLADSRTHQVYGHYCTDKGWEERAFGVGQPIPCAETELTHEQIYAKTGLAVKRKA